ncbi:MAG TPA: excinuclease ABC subunit UvrB [Candidatus Gastranaerophilales bacterium]|nr:excinuclease ABC subunit UvrB [Candidatus Gastranaerophilales bacterium]
MSRNLQIISKYNPSGDQPKAIKMLSDGIIAGYKKQTLLGVTGSGKTFTMAHVIQEVQRPALIIAHNKTLAAQLYNEMKTLLPNNAVEYFISYYDYYQPEAYIPRTDTYIEKTSSINDEIDRLRHSATRSLFERKDVVVVASVSCIYGLGLPENYFKGAIKLSTGEIIERDDILRHLVDAHYERNDIELSRGSFRARGDIIEIKPSYENITLRIQLFGDEIEKISKINPTTGDTLEICSDVIIFPAVHYLSGEEDIQETITLIKNELTERVNELKLENKLLEAQRLTQRTNHDLEMIRELGYCNGIENYSRIFERRKPGTPPATLLDYFSEDFLLFIDESHVTLPQIKGMYNGDQARKGVLIDYGFRLPCAKDNRPLKIEEFWERINQTIFVSATPAVFELENSERIVEQIIRPTGLIDPEVEIRPTKNQIDDLITEIKKRTIKKERILITTLTKKMSEDLTDYLLQIGIKVRYLHSEIQSLERVEILRDLRVGEFDVLVGVNLLREGLDLPEVTLVAIMDADKEGFLRSETSLIQTIGRAARNACGKVIMYADKITQSIQKSTEETERRRKIQIEHNKKYNITPQTIIKPLSNNLLELVSAFRSVEDVVAEKMVEYDLKINDLPKIIEKFEKEMHSAAKILDFEKAAEIRDKLKELREMHRNSIKNQ